MDQYTNPRTEEEMSVPVAAGPPPPPMPVPAVVTVFGILHLVLAVFGVVMVAFSGVMQGFSRGMMAAQTDAPGIAGAQARFQARILEISEKVNVVSYAGMVVLAVLLAVAGILLLKRRPVGIKVSNAYACVSILLKVVGLILFFAWTLPQLEPAMAELTKSGGREAEMFGNVMRISMVASGVLSPVVMCVYPVLVLILLNRPKVKQALAVAG